MTETITEEDIGTIRAAAEAAEATATAALKADQAAAEEKARYEAAAAAAYAKRHQEAADELEGLQAQLRGLSADLEKSLARARHEPSHLDYTVSFVRDIRVRINEVRAWVARNI